MPVSRVPPSRWPLWFESAALAGVLVALGDGLLALGRSAEPLPGGAAAFGFLLLSAVGLYAVPALCLGLLAACVSASAAGLLDGQSLRQDLGRRLRDPAADRDLCAALLAVVFCLGLSAILVYLFARTFAMEMANRRNGALSTALVAAAAVPLVAPAFFPAFRAARLLCRLLPRPRTLWATGLCLLGAVSVIVLAVLSVDWRAISFGPVQALGAFLLLGALGRYALGRAPRSPLLRRLLPGVLLGVQLASLSFVLLRLGDDPHSCALLSDETSGARLLLRTGRRLLDRDRDGYAALLGGGDCDDRNPQIHPGADDVPGDGVDQDCEDGDAPVAAPLPPSPAAAPTGPPLPRWDGNWLILTIDTLRADRLNEQLTPHLWALARRSARFTTVYAQAPNTPRSFPSFLTARYPSQVHFLRRSLNFSPVTGQDPTLFTELSAAGYHTIGIFSHFYLEERTGLHRGFDEWRNDGATNLHDSNSDIAAPRITARVIARLRELGAAARAAQDRPRPFALWTHLFDPHSTYMEHPEFPVPGKGFKHLVARYDAEVAFTDLHVGKILQALAEAGLAERTAIVVFADHGESLGEHRRGGEALYFHGESLYDEVLRVPLLLHVPGLPPQEIGDRVQLIDLAPTVLALAGVPLPASFQGRSLLPRLAGRPLPPQPAYAEMLPCTAWQKNERAFLSGDYKLYARFTDGVMELYNLAEDPMEQHNLAGRLPERVRALRQQLSAFMSATGLAMTAPAR